jgi:hypothetical protein
MRKGEGLGRREGRNRLEIDLMNEKEEMGRREQKIRVYSPPKQDEIGILE